MMWSVEMVQFFSEKAVQSQLQRFMKQPDLKIKYYSLKERKKVSKKHTRTEMICCLAIKLLSFEILKCTEAVFIAVFDMQCLHNDKLDQTSCSSRFVEVFTCFAVIKFILINCVVSRKY